jgi:hypothetical protein
MEESRLNINRTDYLLISNGHMQVITYTQYIDNSDTKDTQKIEIYRKL